MAGKRQNKYVYYTGPQFDTEIEIPLHIQKVKLKADFKTASTIQIEGVIHNAKELKLWQELFRELGPCADVLTVKK